MDARHAIVTFRAQANDRRSSILKAMGEGEGSRAAPRSAIMKRQYVSPGPAHGLSQVDVLLVARKPVKQQEIRVRPRCQRR
jgi:hypothetical protein